MFRRPLLVWIIQAALSVLAALVLTMGSTDARADDDIVSRPHLLGDWGGQRTRLADRGITFNLAHGSETAHNFSGGTEHLTRYTDQWVFGVGADLGRLWGWKGATFQGTVTDRNGRDLGADAQIGNDMLVQEVYGRSQTWHLTQFWIDQRSFDDRLQVKFGRLTVGEDFASFACDFQNLTFCGSQPGNIVGDYWVNWPTSQWALRIKYQDLQKNYAQIGFYQVNPRYLEDGYARRSGWKLDNPSGTTGTLIQVEIGWLPSFDGRPGSYKAGVWYDSSDGADLYDDIDGNPRGLTGLAPRERSGRYGVYLNLEQQITGAAQGRGISAFLNISQADRRTARLDRQIAGGVTYRGPFDRAPDSIGLAVGATHNNGRFARFVRDDNTRTGRSVVAGDGNEYVAELYYSWVPITSVYLRPNLQYLLHPGGTSANRNSLLVGLKTGVTF